MEVISHSNSDEQDLLVNFPILSTHRIICILNGSKEDAMYALTDPAGTRRRSKESCDVDNITLTSFERSFTNVSSTLFNQSVFNVESKWIL